MWHTLLLSFAPCHARIKNKYGLEFIQAGNNPHLIPPLNKLNSPRIWRFLYFHNFSESRNEDALPYYPSGDRKCIWLHKTGRTIQVSKLPYITVFLENPEHTTRDILTFLPMLFSSRQIGEIVYMAEKV